jgi:hypothetical protein
MEEAGVEATIAPDATSAFEDRESHKAICFGGLHSAKIALVSEDFHDIEVLQRSGDWGAFIRTERSRNPRKQGQACQLSIFR